MEQSKNGNLHDKNWIPSNPERTFSPAKAKRGQNTIQCDYDIFGGKARGKSSDS